VERVNRGNVIVNLKQGLYAEDAIEEMFGRGSRLGQVERDGARRIALVDIENIALLDALAAKNAGIFIAANFSHSAADGLGVVGKESLDVVAVDAPAVVKSKGGAIGMEAAQDGPVPDAIEKHGGAASGAAAAAKPQSQPQGKALLEPLQANPRKAQRSNVASLLWLLAKCLFYAVLD